MLCEKWKSHFTNQIKMYNMKYNMKTTSVRELRHHFGRILNWVEEGEEVEITKRHRIVARILPPRTEVKNNHQPKWPDFEARLKATFPHGVKGSSLSDVIDEQRGKRP